VNGAPDGRVSSYLHDHVQVGDVLDVSAPAGDFVLTATESPLLLASAGAGITTVLPIVEHICSNAAATESHRRPRRPTSSRSCAS
jgi:nitric oxide dioxygenase